MGVIHFEDGELDKALTFLPKAEAADPRLPNLHVRLANTYLRIKQEAAERAFQRALEIDGDSPEARLGLAMMHLRNHCNEEAAAEALVASACSIFCRQVTINLLLPAWVMCGAPLSPLTLPFPCCQDCSQLMAGLPLFTVFQVAIP